MATPIATPNASSMSWTTPYTSRLDPAMMAPPASSMAPMVSDRPGNVATSAGAMMRSNSSFAASATNQIANVVTNAADSDGMMTASVGMRPATTTTAPTTAPRNTYAHNAVHAGLMTMPKPSVVMT